MTKRHADFAADFSPTDPNHPWVSRGYRPDFAYSVKKAPIEDPYGEIAYQRALLEAAEARSRRIPDPVLYHNSISAREYIKRRDKAIFSVKPRNANPNSTSQPNTPSTASTPTYSPAQLPSPTFLTTAGSSTRRTAIKSEFDPVLATSRSALHNRDIKPVSLEPLSPSVEHYRSYTPHGIPLTLEPKLDAPLGPSRMLR